MRLTPPAAAIALALVSLPILSAPRQSQRPKESAGHSLTLTVRESPDKTRALPGSSGYFADVLNSGRTNEKLQAFQMPGGYAGSGKFFACGLEGWSAGRRAWTPIIRPNIAQFGHNRLVDVVVGPGERSKVCGMLLPDQGGTAGQCVRFTFRPQWTQGTTHTLFSPPFRIGDIGTADGSPCSPPRSR